MTKYLASVKDNGKIKIMEREYPSMKEFKKDLRANGYKVRFICPPQKTSTRPVKTTTGSFKRRTLLTRLSELQDLNKEEPPGSNSRV